MPPGGLFTPRPTGDLTVAEIARETGLAKGTVFLYFRTERGDLPGGDRAADDRMVPQIEPAGWRSCLPLRHQKMLWKSSPARFQARVYFTRLLAILSTVLEQNANYDAVHQFKHLLLTRLSHTGALLERALAFLPPGEGAHLLMQLEALVIGLRHLADTAPSQVRQLMTIPEISAFDVDFDTEFRQLALAMFRESKDRRYEVPHCSAVDQRCVLPPVWRPFPRCTGRFCGTAHRRNASHHQRIDRHTGNLRRDRAGHWPFLCLLQHGNNPQCGSA